MDSHRTAENCAGTKWEYGLGVLFFGGLWGISESVLGDALYRAGVPHASVPLSAIGFTILTFARAYCPPPGTATLIASFAMLYKFLDSPFAWRASLLPTDAALLLVVREELADVIPRLYGGIPIERLVAAERESIDKVLTILRNNRR